MTQNTTTFWIIGGDFRQYWLARQLAQENFQVHTYALDPTYLSPHPNIHPETKLSPKVEDIILLPIPTTKDNTHLFSPHHPLQIPISQLLENFHTNQRILGAFPNTSNDKGNHFTLFSPFRFTDYLAEESITIANAVPTAEGCIQIAMERLPTTIQDSHFLITGYGFVAKATAQRLKALGGKTTIAARSPVARTQAKADGHQSISIANIPENKTNFSCLINTVPALILGEEELKQLPPTCLLIDLASGEGGFQKNVTESLHLTPIHALSLPGKVAPATASLAIKDTVLQILSAEKNIM